MKDRRHFRYLPSRDQCGLVVIDVQEKLVPFLADREAFLVHLEFLVRTARVVGLPIVVTEQYPKGLGRTEECVRGWLGDHEPVEKMTFSACGENRFLERLERRGILEPIVCGIEAHVCVCQTALDLLAAGRRVHLVEDAIASRHRQDRVRGVGLVERAGGIVTTSEIVAFGLFERAGTSEFKAMQTLVKAKDDALRAAAGSPSS